MNAFRSACVRARSSNLPTYVSEDTSPFRMARAAAPSPSSYNSAELPERVRCFFIVCLSPRGRLEQTLDLRVEISGDQEGCLTPVRSDEARHRVVGQVHSISA